MLFIEAVGHIIIMGAVTFVMLRRLAAHLFAGMGEELLRGESQLVEDLLGRFGRGAAFLARNAVIVCGDKQCGRTGELYHGE